MKYLFLLRDGNNDGPPGLDTAEGQELFGAWRQVLNAMRAEGVLVDCGPLTGIGSATTVRVRDGQVLLADGPAAELKEQVGGYTLVDCRDLDDALAWAARVPTALAGSVEVRPVIDTAGGPKTPAATAAGVRATTG